jgi:uncharacterized protein
VVNPGLPAPKRGPAVKRRRTPPPAWPEPEVGPALTERWVGELGPDLEGGYRGAAPCHDLSHAVRVAVLAERIAGAEGIDGDSAVLAGLLHDVGHAAAAQAGTDDHEQRSAETAVALLRGRVSPALVADVTDAVSGRRFAKLGRPRLPVGAVLDDADNLDAIGFAGVARAFLWLGEHGRPVTVPARPAAGLVALVGSDAEALRRHWSAKLALLPAAMRTATGTRIASRRAAQLHEFLRALEGEVADLISGANWQVGSTARETGGADPEIGSTDRKAGES